LTVNTETDKLPEMRPTCPIFWQPSCDSHL